MDDGEDDDDEARSGRHIRKGAAKRQKMQVWHLDMPSHWPISQQGGGQQEREDIGKRIRRRYSPLLDEDNILLFYINKDPLFKGKT